MRYTVKEYSVCPIEFIFDKLTTSAGAADFTFSVYFESKSSLKTSVSFVNIKELDKRPRHGKSNIEIERGGESAHIQKLTISGLVEVFEDWVGHDEKDPFLPGKTIARVVVGGKDDTA